MRARVLLWASGCSLTRLAQKPFRVLPHVSKVSQLSAWKKRISSAEPHVSRSSTWRRSPELNMGSVPPSTHLYTVVLRIIRYFNLFIKRTQAEPVIYTASTICSAHFASLCFPVVNSLGCITHASRIYRELRKGAVKYVSLLLGSAIDLVPINITNRRLCLF